MDKTNGTNDPVTGADRRYGAFTQATLEIDDTSRTRELKGTQRTPPEIEREQEANTEVS